jgi:glycyl-tRNA synthetase beta chain
MTSSNELQTLLIELGTEELPPKSLRALDLSFQEGIKEQLDQLGFSYSRIIGYGAPRRLAVRVENCQRQQGDKQIDKRGPAVAAAFDANGEPTKAASGWARANGIEVAQAQRLTTDKGEWLLHRATVKGRQIDELIEDVINAALKRLPVGKAMRWGSSSVEFIRPAHILCVMYGSEVLPATVLGITSSNQCSGHRFHGDHRFDVRSADTYEAQMQTQYVIPDYARRMAEIETQLQQQASALGLVADYDQSLLEEISSLVEWPVVLQATFEQRFLAVPKEALIYTMKDDQKYVPLLDTNGELCERFLFVSNIESRDPSQVISGNEKVIRPRLSDAEFFFETDKKTSLADKCKALDNIVFQKDLGTVGDKSRRVASIVKSIGEIISVSEDNIALAQRAAELAKADLVSNMVMEFPSVQGVMGKHYALHDGEASEVAVAIEEQYLPRFANDVLPQTPVGMLLSLSEKLDTLVGIFGVNFIPKGDKDPFALRRSAIGILRMLVAFDVDVSVETLIEAVAAQYGSLIKNKEATVQVTSFLLDRCKAFYADQDISADVVSAVMSVKGTKSLSDIDSRVKAVAKFAKTSAASSLVEANKRVANILAKNEIELENVREIDANLLASDEESALYREYLALSAKQNGITDYDQLLTALSTLREPLTTYFDNVMIMAEDNALKQNRIGLLANVRALFMSVADISVLNIQH